mgnify:CR=1 FL=1
MAMKVVYATANGRVLSETRNGSRRLYSLDPLGNTRALYDNTQTKTDTFTYFPSGTVASRTGTTPTPFQWNGGSGYYQNSSNRVYVRARNFYVNLGRWSTQDPIGFKAGDYNLYRYVNNRFVNVTDPSGLSAASCVFGGQMRGRSPGNNMNPAIQRAITDAVLAFYADEPTYNLFTNEYERCAISCIIDFVGDYFNSTC